MFEKKVIFMQNVTKKIARAGVIGGLYIVLSLLTLPISGGAIQFRISEALTVLPLLFPESVIGLFLGCALSNLIVGCPIWDVLLGSAVTLVSGLATLGIGKLIKNTPLKIILGGLPPVMFNAFILPVVWLMCYGNLQYAYIIQACLLLASQSVSVYALGVPLYLSINGLRDKGFFKF